MTVVLELLLQGRQVRIVWAWGWAGSDVANIPELWIRGETIHCS